MKKTIDTDANLIGRHYDTILFYVRCKPWADQPFGRYAVSVSLDGEVRAEPKHGEPFTTIHNLNCSIMHDIARSYGVTLNGDPGWDDDDESSMDVYVDHDREKFCAD